MRYAHLVTADRGLQLGAEPAQQRVARRVAEAVVVALEAVEVEQQQQVRQRLVLGAQQLEVAQQLEPVAEPGQRVGPRLSAGEAEALAALVVRHREAADHGEHRGGGERHGKRLGRGPVVLHEQREAAEREDDRQDDARHVVGRAGLPPRGLPRREADDQRAGDPPDVEQRAGGVGLAGHLEEVDAVADREHAEPGTEHDPRPVEPLAAGGHDADDEPDQDHVGERVRQVGDDRRGVAAGRGAHGLEDHGGGDRGNGERRDQAVEP
jgi:hypothetical protein